MEGFFSQEFYNVVSIYQSLLFFLGTWWPFLLYRFRSFFIIGKIFFYYIIYCWFLPFCSVLFFMNASYFCSSTFTPATFIYLFSCVFENDFQDPCHWHFFLIYFLMMFENTVMVYLLPYILSFILNLVLLCVSIVLIIYILSCILLCLFQCDIWLILTYSSWSSSSRKSILTSESNFDVPLLCFSLLAGKTPFREGTLTLPL